MEATDESKGFRKRRGFIFAVMTEVAANLGYCFGALVPLILLLCVHRRRDRYELVWRLTFGLAMVPPLVIFWFRMRMAVTTAFRKSAMRKQKVPYLLIVKKYWRRLLAGGWTWFIYNWISIPFGVFSSTVVSKVNADQSLVKTLGWGVLINSFYIPGPFIGGLLVDKIGAKRTMALGYSLQAILGFILGGAYYRIQSVFPLFVIMYGIFLTLGEVGPGRYGGGTSSYRNSNRLTDSQRHCRCICGTISNFNPRSSSWNHFGLGQGRSSYWYTSKMIVMDFQDYSSHG